MIKELSSQSLSLSTEAESEVGSNKLRLVSSLYISVIMTKKSAFRSKTFTKSLIVQVVFVRTCKTPCSFSFYIVDTTIRGGLYHEFKKHGDVGQIKVFGRDNNRHAIVYFRR